MKWFFCFIVMFFTCIVSAQDSIKKTAPRLRWEVSVGSGIYCDVSYLNILSDGRYSPIGYTNIKANRVNIGKVDRMEVKYFFNNKAALSFYFHNAQFRSLYGIGLDPLQVWTELKDITFRRYYTVMYNRIFRSGKRNYWTVGSGFEVQIERTSFPYYEVDNRQNPTQIVDIGGKPTSSYFENWAIPLTIAYHWTINKNLKLGLLFNTAYTAFIGVDGMSLQGNIAIPFGNPVGRFKGRRIITP